MIKRVILKHGEEQRILSGHLWIFGNEIRHVLVQRMPGSIAAEPEPGEIVDVEYSRRGKPAYPERGFASPCSKIAVRIYSPSNAETLETARLNGLEGQLETCEGDVFDWKAGVHNPRLATEKVVNRSSNRGMDPTGIMNPVSGRPSLRLRWIRPGDSGCRIPATRPRITPYSPVTVNPSA